MPLPYRPGRDGLDSTGGRRAASSEDAAQEEPNAGPAGGRPWLRYGSVAAVIMLALASLILLELRTDYLRHRATTIRELRNTAALIGDRTEQMLASVDLLLNLINERTAMENARAPERFEAWAGRDELRAIFLRRLQQVPHLAALTIHSPSGRIVTSTRPLQSETEDRLADHVEPIQRGAQWYIGQPYLRQNDGRTVVDIAKPVISGNNLLLGILVASVDLDQLTTIVTQMELQPSWRMMLTRGDGLVLATMPRAAAVVGSLGTGMMPQGGAAAGRSAEAWRVAARPDGDVFVVERPLDRFGIAVVLSVATREVFHDWLTDSAFLMIAGGICALAVLAAALFGASSAIGRQKFKRMAETDGLTGLYNRYKLNHYIARVTSRDWGKDHSFAVIYLDVDGFKEINDTLGHKAGDEVLVAISDRLLTIMNSYNAYRWILARLGGDEFAAVIAIPKRNDIRQTISFLCERIIGSLGGSYHIQSRELTIGVSVGVSLRDDGDAPLDDLLRLADLALYRAKAEGGGCFRFHTRQMSEEAIVRSELAQDLRRALALGRDGGIEAFFQPIVDVATLEVRSFEALARWRHPDRGFISPDVFIGIAEERGLIRELSDIILHSACEAAQSWDPHIGVAVNLSAVQFRGGGLVESISNALARTGLSPSRLILEITEGVLLSNTDATLRQLRKLHEMGARIALDDFGVGYSSLSYLLAFPFDKIKIDKAFVKNILSDSRSQSVVRSCCHLFADIRMQVVAEGVEDIKQLEILGQFGCHEVQGFLFSRPVPRLAVQQTLRAIEDFAHSLRQVAS